MRSWNGGSAAGAILSALSAATIAILPVSSGPAQAQAPLPATATRPVDRIGMAAEASSPVIPDVFYEGWRATQLLEQSVSSFRAEELGQVKDILVRRNGRIKALVVVGGGLLGFGEAAFPLPWPLVQLTPGEDGIVVPFTKADAERQGLFGGPARIETEPGVYRVSDLLDAAVRLRADNRAGTLKDVVFSPEGQAIAVMVELPHRDGEAPGPIPSGELPSIGTYADADSGRTLVVLPDDAVVIASAPPRAGSE